MRYKDEMKERWGGLMVVTVKREDKGYIKLN